MEGVPLPQLDLDPRPASAAAVATAALHAVSAMAPPAL
ncbi:MAG TPA: serine kinase, partial [Brevundimonas sp.]|nr:serine kinase [Brevundimonas sp.]